MSSNHHNAGAAGRNNSSRDVDGADRRLPIIPLSGIYSVAALAACMGLTAECLKRYLQQTGIECCIPLGGTTWVDAARFQDGLARQPFQRQQARGGGARRRKVGAR